MCGKLGTFKFSWYGDDGVAILWGLDNYQSDYYLSCQLFIIANLVVFNALTQLFSLRFEHKAIGC